MRPVLVLALSLFAVACLLTGAASMLGATGAGNRVDASMPVDAGSSLIMQQDHPQEHLLVQVNIVRHASRPEWVVAVLLAFVVVGLWVLFAAFDVRIPEIR